MLAILTMGFLIGMRHALDPDHLVAVTALSSGDGRRPSLVRHGLVWGAGHALTLFGIAAVAILAGEVVPRALAETLQLAVAVMLVGLGASTLWGLRPGRSADRYRPASLTAARPLRQRLSRTLAVGLAQGMAGSATLLVLAVTAAGDPSLALAYVLLFGLGSMAGMALLAALIALPLTRAAARYGHLLRWIGGCAGGLTLLLGLTTLLELRVG